MKKDVLVKERVCFTCAGKGWVTWFDPNYGPSESRSCETCKGTGKVKLTDAPK